MKKIFTCLFLAFSTISLVSSAGTGMKINKNSDKNDAELSQAYTSHGVKPDLLSEAPQKLLHVEYKKTHKEVNLGNELAPKDVKEQPLVTYEEADPHAFYTLVMTDPDAPSRKQPIRKEFNHWLVVNIPGAELKKGDISGESISEYVGSGPPKGSGLHRYVFLLYKQPEKMKFDEPHKSKNDGNRAKFSTQNFAMKYKLGHPLAGNFYQAEFDESVPELHKQLGF